MMQNIFIVNTWILLIYSVVRQLKSYDCQKPTTVTVTLTVVNLGNSLLKTTVLYNFKKNAIIKQKIKNYFWQL